VRHRILIVDDEKVVLFAMSDYFTLQGYQVDCAQDLAEAEQLLRANQYSVVIVDLRLTGSQGTEGLGLIGYVRERYPSTRTILLTAYGSLEVEMEAHRLGIDALLSKPKHLAEVAATVSQLLAVSL
jgi:DNA-binding response OmpR family regulator